MSSNLNFLAADGEIAALMRKHDWSSSPLGAPAAWPQALKTAVSLMLHAPSAVFIAWGPQLCLLCNDACRQFPGDRASPPFGLPVSQSWEAIHPDVEAIYLRAIGGGAALLRMTLSVPGTGGDGARKPVFSCCPIHDGDEVAGLYCVLESTAPSLGDPQSRGADVRRLHQLFERAPCMVALLRGPDHRFEFANPAYLALAGHRDIVGKTVRDALPELADQGFIALLDQVYRTGESCGGTAVPALVRRTPDSPAEERLIDFTYQPIRNDEGDVTGIFVEGFDMTETVKATAALRESEHRLKQLANTIPQLAWMTDAEGRAQWFNDRWYAYTGETAENTEGQGWHRLHDPALLPKVLERWNHSLKTGEPFEMTFPLRGQDGHFRPFFTLVAPLKDSSGRIVQWFGTNTDVSSLQEAEDERRRAEERLRLAIDAGRIGIWDWDIRRNKVTWSDRVYELHEIAPGEFGGTVEDFAQLVHPDDRESIWRKIDAAMKSKDGFSAEFRTLLPGGRVKWLSTWARMHRSGNGEADRMVGATISIDRHKNAEAALKENDRRKDEFLAMLAHELRNPLAPICTAAELLKNAGNDARRVQFATGVISRQVKHLTELVDDLLDVSRVTRGIVVLDKVDLDLKHVVAAAIEQARPLIESRGHRFVLNMSAAQAWVHADRTRLIQVLVNLLTNAAKYTPHGGEIVLSVEAHASEVGIAVRDNGSGIEPSLLPHVFELFTQGTRTPDRAQGGLGLGLALVKSMMALHGGRVEAHSEGVGKGSRFAVFLPSLKEKAAPADFPDAPQHNRVSRRLRVLIVDDNSDAAHTLATLLQESGHEVTIREDGAGALKEAAANPPQVCILDIGLPDMDGYELVRRLRAQQDTAQAIYIALTGYGQAQNRELSAAAGFDHHFVKPIDLPGLADILSRAGVQGASAGYLHIVPAHR